MLKLGYNLEVMHLDPYIESRWNPHLPVPVRSIVENTIPQALARQDRRVVFFPPTSYKYLHGERTLAITMFEASKLPPGWVSGINKWADRMVLPSTWCAEVFEHNGVRIPIDVVPLAVNFAKYPRVERWPSPVFVFMMYGNLSKRKGVDIAYRAFKKAFQGKTDVVLVLKTIRHTLRCKEAWDDDQVVVINEDYTPVQMMDLLKQVDVVLATSRGEGFGMCPAEAMATGTAVILTDGTGQSDMCDERYNIPVPVKATVKADYEFCWLTEDVGEWVEPDEDYLVDAMRWCYQNPEKTAEMGQRSAGWVRTRYGMIRHGRGIERSMEATFD